MAWLDGMGARLVRGGTQAIALRDQRLRDLARALPRVESLLDGPRQRLDIWSDRLPAALTSGVQRRRLALSETSGSLRPRLLRGRLETARERLEDRAARLRPGLARSAERRRETLDRCLSRLDAVPERVRRDLDRKRAEFDRLTLRLKTCGDARVRSARERLENAERLRKTLGYEATLERGYAVVRDGEGGVLTRKAQAEGAGALEIQFADGRLKIGGAKPGGRKSKPEKPEQGSLF